jgi:hypothetical protein
MKTKEKTFDCVEMKDRIQRDLMKEFQARRSEFASYVDFINATANQNPAIRAWRETMKHAHPSAKG